MLVSAMIGLVGVSELELDMLAEVEMELFMFSGRAEVVVQLISGETGIVRGELHILVAGRVWELK